MCLWWRSTGRIFRSILTTTVHTHTAVLWHQWASHIEVSFLHLFKTWASSRTSSSVFSYLIQHYFTISYPKNHPCLSHFAFIIHRESKKQDTKLLPITLPNTNTTPHPKRVATLPCEIWMQKMASFWNTYCN